MSDKSTSGRPSPRPVWAALACALVLLAHHSPLAAQDIPVSGRPTSDFYGASGVGVKVAWSLDRTTVPLDEDIVATLVITNVTNPKAVARPNLKASPKFHTQFTVIDQPDPRPGETEVRFVYRLRPRDLAVKEIPRLDFYYFNPTAAAGKQFPLTQSQKLPITVSPPKPKVAPPAVPLREPDHLFAVTRGSSVLDGPPFEPCTWGWAGVWAAGPLAAAAWFLVWRWVYPDATRLAKMRRSRAARRATDAIRRASGTPDPPAAIANAILGYLRSRFPLPEGAVTPTEVGTALAELGMADAECEEVAAFLHVCDAARFSASSDSDTSLAATATALVARLEAL